MPNNRTENGILRRAMADARLRESDVAHSIGVDPKTVHRWLGGRRPQAQHRWALAELVGVHEYDLWPDLTGAPAIEPEIVAIYPHRAAVPRQLWRELLASAKREISILVYSGLFLAEDVDLVRLLADKASNGVTVRLLLGDPDSPAVADRGVEEGIAGAMAAKIRNAIVLYQPLRHAPSAEIRLHSTVLYNSLYRADEDLVINQHIHGIGGAFAPVVHLRRRPDGHLHTTYLDSFERIWASARPLD